MEMEIVLPDEVAVMTYHDRAELRQEFTRDRRAVDQALRYVPPHDERADHCLNIALDKYAGTLIFVSHDREFVSSLATRILEVKDGKVIDFQGGYEDYLSSQGIE